ncbi:hypothetical protein CFIMG_007488RA00001 [Ceratocystis fimbriata CBS 114723]|uniref:Histone chaperone domain-containing protein n=1 Tax=Ceratocystis fimbriata CBS 114723 TaxID=1035309 RepID=A0A2C5X5Y2_9PEZI|nr:hypothetical protein CFIMG_007488RA00001 [Ceratocystis fimbriata CBS 114723]
MDNGSTLPSNAQTEDSMEEDDGMEEIDTSNIIAGGRRTRGKIIDFAKAAAENPGNDDEEEDDEDFESNNMDED